MAAIITVSSVLNTFPSLVPRMYDLIACTLIMSTGVFVFYYPTLKVKNFIIYVCMMFVLGLGILFTYFPIHIAAWIPFNYFYLKKFTGKKHSVVIFCLIYIIGGLATYITPYLTNIVFHQVLDHCEHPIDIIKVLVALLPISLPPIIALRFLYKKYQAKILDGVNGHIFLFISLSLIFSIFFVYGLVETSGYTDIPHMINLFRFLLFTSYFLFNIISIIIILFTTKKNYENQQQLNNLRIMREYTDNLEATYNNLRSFKHDYINILSSLAFYIDDKRYDELSDFFHEKIMPLTDELNQKNASLANLSRVKNLEIKSILYTKFLMAINKDIEVTVDIPDEIDNVNIDSVDLTRILGVYLDNAIEAALETEHPQVNFHLGTVGDSAIFIISNSYKDHGLSISQMTQKNVSSKGKEHGLGLYNVSKILGRYENIFAETSMTDDMFTQQLQIV